jgi:opacity protein-like surface antigen
MNLSKNVTLSLRAPLKAALRAALGAIAIAALGAIAPAQAQTRSSSSSTPSQGDVARVRVTALKTPLRETCSETSKVKGTVAEGDELDVVNRVDSAWYRVRLPGSGGVEGCVASRAVEPVVEGVPRRGPATAAPSSQRRPVPPAPARTPPRKQFGVSGFVDLGQSSFTAKDSFEAILDTASGPFFGGGGQVNLPLNLFARVDVTRFRKDGERAFVSNGDVFKLGIPTTITVMPIEVTGGYRREFRLGRGPARGAKPGARPSEGFRLIPYVGGGAGVVKYKETADFAQAGDDVDESFTSYHFLGGVEVPLWKFVGVGAEYHHRWVPDALGTGGVSAEFNETDLGGGTFRFRVIVGF